MTTIHRLLDEAFAGIEPNADVLDLKEEIRANLEARAAELEASGQTADAAARRAFDELGDVRELLAEVPTGLPGDPWQSPAWRANRVRPRPAFVVRTVLLSLLAFASLVVIVLDAFELVPVPLAGLALAVVGIALPMGFVIADALRQETTTNHPLPTARAIGFGVAGGLVLLGVGVAWLLLQGLDLVWLAAAITSAVVGIGLFAYLGATTTNRHKAWALEHSAQFNGEPDRFSQDPAAAARFGIYSMVIIVVAVVAFLVLSFTIGWAWSWIALVAGFLVMMIVLARMLFPPKKP